MRWNCYLLLVLLVGATVGSSRAKAADGPTPDAAVQRRIQRVVLDFSKARRNEARRLELIAKAAELGDPAPTRLLVILEKELSPQLRGYRERLTKVAQSLEQNRAKSINAAEVNELRTRVLALRNDPNLTKEMIVETGDPAMKQLAEILLPDLEMVAKSSASLVRQREALLQAGRVWEAAATVAAQLASAKTGEAVPPPRFESYLRGEEEVAMQMGTTLDPQARKVLAANAQLAGKLDPEEANCIAACNLTRGLLGLRLLEIDPLLCQTARDHSSDMESKGFFSHESPVEGKKTPWDRAKRFNTTASGENIAVGVSQGSAANEMWFHSPGHHRNMLGEHVRIGVGRSGVHWTEMFGS